MVSSRFHQWKTTIHRQQPLKTRIVMLKTTFESFTISKYIRSRSLFMLVCENLPFTMTENAVEHIPIPYVSIASIISFVSCKIEHMRTNLRESAQFVHDKTFWPRHKTSRIVWFVWQISSKMSIAQYLASMQNVRWNDGSLFNHRNCVYQVTLCRMHLVYYFGKCKYHFLWHLPIIKRLYAVLCTYHLLASGTIRYAVCLCK